MFSSQCSVLSWENIQFCQSVIGKRIIHAQRRIIFQLPRFQGVFMIYIYVYILYLELSLLQVLLNLYIWNLKQGLILVCLAALLLQDLFKFVQIWLQLASYPGPLRGGKGPGTHCMRMPEVYRAFSSKIRRIPSPPRGWAGTDNVY